MGCITFPENNSNITVTYMVKNISNYSEWVVIQYIGVLGEITEELYMESGEIWTETVNFILPEYGNEYLHIVAHSWNRTFETTITINEINQSINALSRIKPSGSEYLSMAQMYINRETVGRYRN